VKRIAVLPFENLGSPDDDYFADGIADAVRGKLTSLPGIEVIARGSSVGYKKTAKTPKQIAGELDIRYLLTATVRWQKSGGSSRVQVSPELVEVKASGAPASKWQQPFDASLTDVFQVQGEIAARVAQALGVVLGTVEEKGLAAKPTQNLAAYDAFLKAQELCKSLACDDPSVSRKALGFYEQAVALDPGFAQAWARVSGGNIGLYLTSSPTPEVAERARQAAEKAVALAPDRPEGYIARGGYRNLVLNDPVAAQTDYARALSLGAPSAELLQTKATVERDLGHWDAAVDAFRQAERLDPLAVGPKTMLGFTFLYLRRYPEARQSFDAGLALAPANMTLIVLKAETFLAEANLSAARAVLAAPPAEVERTGLTAYVAMGSDLGWVLDEAGRELLLRLTPAAFDNDRAVWAICLAQASYLKGDASSGRRYAEEARQAFEEQARGAPQNSLLHSNLGLALAYLGQKDAAIREGERGVALRPVARDAFTGPYHQHLLARIYVLTGEPEKALAILEQLLKIPYDAVSPGFLRIDPNFDALRGNPKFLKLLE
jgi:TolB-like protein/Flp pilus assembly protein TadD